MNFLAHAYLSFNDPGILAGNMISDFVKGKKQYGYPIMIQNGIRLHRSIDAFTDNHPSTKEINKFFHPTYRLYSGAFTDIVYDYFLANDQNEFESHKLLENFTRQTYMQLDQNIYALPLEFQNIYPHMRKHNWLYSYSNDFGIMKSFSGMAGRAKYIYESETAYAIFLKNKTFMHPFYEIFFPLLKQHALDTLNDLLNAD
jgi:acyl carrier protein phosphodiesterase